MSELVTDYLDGALTRPVRLRARLHLFLCFACRRYFAQMRRTAHLLSSGSRRPPAAEVEQSALESLARGGHPPSLGDDR